MCVKPYSVPVGELKRERVMVQCGKCWRCRANRQNDLIGRALAEMQYAAQTWYVTLTYDNRKLKSPYQATVIHKRDFQNFLKSLRFAGHKLRYVATAETGTKGTRRVHFHALLMWQGLPPVIAKYWNGRDALAAWPWGHVDIVKGPQFASVRYVCKYVTKHLSEKERDLAVKGQVTTWVTYSKKPVLGERFVIECATRQAAAGFLPAVVNYTPPGGDARAKYSFTGIAEHIYLDTLFGLRPDLLRVRRSEWMHNAVLRWQKRKAKLAFRGLRPAEQREAIGAHMREPFARKELTKAERLRISWENHDAAARGQAWLKSLEEERANRAQDLRRAVFRLLGYQPETQQDVLQEIKELEHVLRTFREKK